MIKYLLFVCCCTGILLSSCSSEQSSREIKEKVQQDITASDLVLRFEDIIRTLESWKTRDSLHRELLLERVGILKERNDAVSQKFDVHEKVVEKIKQYQKSLDSTCIALAKNREKNQVLVYDDLVEDSTVASLRINELQKVRDSIALSKGNPIKISELDSIELLIGQLQEKSIKYNDLIAHYKMEISSAKRPHKLYLCYNVFHKVNEIERPRFQAYLSFERFSTSQVNAFKENLKHESYENKNFIEYRIDSLFTDEFYGLYDIVFEATEEIKPIGKKDENFSQTQTNLDSIEYLTREWRIGGHRILDFKGTINTKRNNEIAMVFLEFNSKSGASSKSIYTENIKIDFNSPASIRDFEIRNNKTYYDNENFWGEIIVNTLMGFLTIVSAILGAYMTYMKKDIYYESLFFLFLFFAIGFCIGLLF